ncbi:hypothetical protein HYDPIDRAFT_30990 [Hydnomerulius pinastri MD-312]|nr:hypothetical protein HYDPIDRAFT_30990 [Hydnomerulius pinastri MD-312]
MNDQDAFDFIDPADILRGCHLIPAFAKGRSHPDHTALSPIAKDSDDWKYYYVNRFVDRDMLLQYHWGLSVGYTYSHIPSTPTHPDSEEPTLTHDLRPLPPAQNSVLGETPAASSTLMNLESTDPKAEFSLIDCNALEWEALDCSSSAESSEANTTSDDNSSVMHEMYGSDWGDGEVSD